MAVKKQASKSVKSKQSAPETPFQVGKSYFIRTVTYHLTGQVKQILGGFLVLEVPRGSPTRAGSCRR
jgi:hypothetical protein